MKYNAILWFNLDYLSPQFPSLMETIEVLNALPFGMKE